MSDWSDRLESARLDCIKEYNLEGIGVSDSVLWHSIYPLKQECYKIKGMKKLKKDEIMKSTLGRNITIWVNRKGQLHNTTGPAKIENGVGLFYLEGVVLTPQAWHTWCSSDMATKTLGIIGA